MVRLTLDKAYTVHARSTDRTGDNDTPSNYRLTLNDPITCPNNMYMKCTLINAKIPSTFYQIDSRNRSLRLVFNDFRTGQADPTDDSPFVHTLVPNAKSGVAVDQPITGKPHRADYLRIIDVSLDIGNYTIEQLITHVENRLNTACTAAHTTEPFRTFIRGATTTSAEAVQDIADAGLASSPPTIMHVVSKPVFKAEYNEKLNKVRIHRTDEGGRMVLGAFWMQCSGTKLNKALGFTTITAQMERRLNIIGQATPVITSNHYRQFSMHSQSTSITSVAEHKFGTTTKSQLEYYGYPVPQTNTTTTDDNGNNVEVIRIGHGVYSSATVNIYANDTVYVRIRNLPSNSYETLSGGASNVMAQIPMYVGSASENFHSPANPTSTVLGQATVSMLDVQLTGADGVPLDFNDAENEFSLLFKAFQLQTYENKPPSENYTSLVNESKFTNRMDGASARMAAPLPSRYHANLRSVNGAIKKSAKQIG